LIAAAQARSEPVVIADIPLLFESLGPARFDGVILVDAPVPYRRARLIHDRGLAPHDADALIAVQMPAEEKRPLATWVIDNDRDRSTLEARTRVIWEELRR
jgi:dephospho-CoA kinase